MMSIFKKLTSAVHNRTTYRVGLIQAKAYRILKQKTTALLKPYDLSTIEWAFLGLLFDNHTVRPTTAAEELGVEAPFVTVMTSRLKKKGLIITQKDASDSRAKILVLTPLGKAFVERIEGVVRGQMRPIIEGASTTDLIGYLATLERIIANDVHTN